MEIYYLTAKMLSLVNCLFTTSQRKYLTRNTCFNVRQSHPSEDTVASSLPYIFGLVTKGPTPPPTLATTLPPIHLSTQSPTCSHTCVVLSTALQRMHYLYYEKVTDPFPRLFTSLANLYPMVHVGSNRNRPYHAYYYHQIELY